MNNLKKLYNAGQSPWYDNIERAMIKNGKLKELFNAGIMGVTSNPSIFEKAINNSQDYDLDIERLAQSGKSVLEIYDELTTQDVSCAADMLFSTYNSTNRIDGYVSIEVLPQYSHDVEKTMDYARMIFKKLGRPNIMIKVPGTYEAPEAIEALIKDGINVNVTLLFSVQHYKNIADAYIRGLKKRLSEGKDISRVNSVASVFISRIDTKIDKMLEELSKKETDLKRKKLINSLLGKIAVANSKMLYQIYRDKFLKEEFKQLACLGANVQRLLWASTSTKNPAYSDVKYVEELIAEHTINTLPHQTVEAFSDHGKVDMVIDKNIKEAKTQLETLKSLGIDILDVCQIIQDEGLEAFQKSFDTLIDALSKKLKTSKTAIPAQ